jgi:hypothetical protein
MSVADGKTIYIFNLHGANEKTDVYFQQFVLCVEHRRSNTLVVP